MMTSRFKIFKINVLLVRKSLIIQLNLCKFAINQRRYLHANGFDLGVWEEKNKL